MKKRGDQEQVFKGYNETDQELEQMSIFKIKTGKIISKPSSYHTYLVIPNSLLFFSFGQM